MAPYEALGIKLTEAYIETIKGQPPDVREALWRLFLTDVQASRQFWGKMGQEIEEFGDKVGSIFKPERPK
jgi:hypothetical protein